MSKSETEDQVEFRQARANPASGYAPAMKESNPVLGAITLTQGGPVVAHVPEIDDTKTVRYLYRCKHCGHEWSEDRLKVDKIQPSADYKGD